MQRPKVELEKELGLILERLKVVKEAGHGEIRVKVADGKVVYITHSIGEEISGSKET